MKERIQQDIIHRIKYSRTHVYAYEYLITKCDVIENAVAREQIKDRTKMVIADISKIRYTLERTPMNDDTVIIVDVLFDEIRTLNDELSCILETDRDVIENITYLQSRLNWHKSKDSQDREWYEENKQYLRNTTSKF